MNNDFVYNLDNILSDIRSMLLSKNEKYGNAALEPLGIFSHYYLKYPELAGILYRVDDKISRIKNEDNIVLNDVKDLIGYLILLLIGYENHYTKPSKYDYQYGRGVMLGFKNTVMSIDGVLSQLFSELQNEKDELYSPMSEVIQSVYTENNTIIQLNYDMNEGYILLKLQTDVEEEFVYSEYLFNFTKGIFEESEQYFSSESLEKLVKVMNKHNNIVKNINNKLRGE